MCVSPYVLFVTVQEGALDCGYGVGAAVVYNVCMEAISDRFLAVHDAQHGMASTTKSSFAFGSLAGSKVLSTVI